MRQETQWRFRRLLELSHLGSDILGNISSSSCYQYPIKGLRSCPFHMNWVLPKFSSLPKILPKNGFYFISQNQCLLPVTEVQNGFRRDCIKMVSKTSFSLRTSMIYNWYQSFKISCTFFKKTILCVRDFKYRCILKCINSYADIILISYTHSCVHTHACI